MPGEEGRWLFDWYYTECPDFLTQGEEPWLIMRLASDCSDIRFEPLLVTERHPEDERQSGTDAGIALLFFKGSWRLFSGSAGLLDLFPPPSDEMLDPSGYWWNLTEESACAYARRICHHAQRAILESIKKAP